MIPPCSKLSRCCCCVACFIMKSEPLFLSSTLRSRKCLSIESTLVKGTLTAELSHGPSYEESVL